MKNEVLKMSRERMVTRTVETAKLTVMVCDTETATVSTEEYSISASIPEEKRISVLRKLYETDTIKIVSIVKTDIIETLYGMPEAEFIRLASVLPPRKNGDIDTESL
jgi:hypothetical protein